MENTTINDVYQPIPDRSVILKMHIGQGQPSKTSVLLGTGKILDTSESDISLDLTQFKNPIKNSVLRVRCVIQDQLSSGRSSVIFTISDGNSTFDSQLPNNDITPIGGFIVYTYRIHLI